MPEQTAFIPEDLSAQAKKLKPQYNSKMSAQAHFEHELECLAKSFGFSIKSLLEQAENSKTYNPLHLKALSLQRKISFYKS